MTRRALPLWTIDQLTQRVGAALQAADYDGVDSGRVSDVPALRTIRYYTTLGILDRPAEMRGRTALYSTRHLLQLAAIKRLQARGLALTDVQEQLAGLPDAALRKVAQVPSHVEDLPSPPPPAEEPSAPSRRETSFWTTPAAVPEPVATPLVSNIFQTVPVSGQLMVMVQTAVPLTEQDVEAVREAAGALLQTLQQRGLLKAHQGEEK
jgi:DNA-binding transcriptional MerR regulator